MERRVLGKGLEALIPKKTTSATPKEFVYLPIEKIKPARYQPRQAIDKGELEELARSIKEKGFIQPIVVRRTESDYYEIVAGGRRYEASKSLGLKEIPTIIKDLSNQDAFVLAILENLQRKDLNPIEEATAFKRLMEEFSFSLEDLARFLSKDKTTISNSLRLLNLPDKVKKALEAGEISRTQARAILSVDKLRDQEKLFRKILKEKLSVREIEKKARLIARKKPRVDPFISELEDRLQKLLGTKVVISNKKNNRGKITIEYYSLDDLERVISRFK
ncbi:MAG: ParB/RepB/Spo0J family partition protein [Candidatus Omnitrophica bacterium]|nr:ParB/RepB/Spo0J family partition protein [Candidatus Omnitrophota bacterium]